MIYEKRIQLYRLLKSTYKGRKYVIRAKLLIAAGITCFLVLFLYGGNYLFSMHQYGFGDLERPVQSVTAMYESPYMLSVGEYLMLYLLLKMFVCYVIALAMMWLAQKAGQFFGCSFRNLDLLGFGEYLLCLLLPSVSYMDVLKYVNLAQYIKVYPLLSQYHNLDVFGISGQRNAHIFGASASMPVAAFGCQHPKIFPLRQSKGAMEKEEAEERTCICDG